MAIYQFLIAVRQSNATNPAAVLTNADGETTSHIQGMFNRTIRFLTEGVRPVYVFDGKPPNIKSHELVKRREKREKAEKELAKAKEEGDIENQEKQAKRLVRAGQKENDDCKRLLRLMGVPVVEAPCEAEAQAASLGIEGKVWGVGTEDMDALTFRTPILLRKMTFANASKSTLQQMDYKKALDGLGLTQAEFVDLCILLGCDYCDSIRGIGPKTALKLIRQHGSIEEILKNLDRKKYTVPDDWVPHEKQQEKSQDEGEEREEEENDDDKEEKEEIDSDKSNTESNEKQEKDKEEEEEVVEPIYVKARGLFNNHEVKKDVELKWKPCQAEELTKFLVDEMGFSPERVQSNIAKLQKAFKATSKPQQRMDSFFKPVPGAAKKKGNIGGGAKRKGGKADDKKTAKKGKGFFGKK
jgi:flap endonuclease-1